MYYKSNKNPSRIFRSMADLEAAQAEAVESGDLAKIDEVFQLTWVDETSTTFISGE